MKCSSAGVSNPSGCTRRVPQCFGKLTYAPMGLSCVLATACRPTVAVSATTSPQLVVSHVVKKLSIVSTHSKEKLVKGTTQSCNAASCTDRNARS